MSYIGLKINDKDVDKLEINDNRISICTKSGKLIYYRNYERNDPHGKNYIPDGLNSTLGTYGRTSPTQGQKDVQFKLSIGKVYGTKTNTLGGLVGITFLVNETNHSFVVSSAGDPDAGKYQIRCQILGDDLIITFRVEAENEWEESISLPENVTHAVVRISIYSGSRILIIYELFNNEKRINYNGKIRKTPQYLQNMFMDTISVYLPDSGERDYRDAVRLVANAPISLVESS